MKRLLSFCLVLCVFLSLSIGFSVTANAETVTGHTVRQDIYLIDKDGDILWEDFYSFTPNNKDQETYEVEHDECTANQLRGMQIYHRTVWNIFAPTSGYPFETNKVNRVSLENFYYRYLMDDSGLHYVSQYDDIYIMLTYVDNSTERIDVEVFADTDLGLDINFSFTPTKNVSRLDLYVDSNLYQHIRTPYGSDQIIITSYFGEIKGDNKYNFNIEFQSEEAGLLSGILGWIQNIFNKIGDLFTELSNIGQTLLRLPQELWSRISEGLKALFIPTQEDITEFKTKMDTLLENKLGAVYQVSNTVIEAWDRIQESDETDTIEFPSTTINLPGGNEFTFGGYDVKIVPDGFSIVVTALKSIVGIVCTIAFVNGLRKRYDEVMGVVQ